jgi:MFS family permease
MKEKELLNLWQKADRFLKNGEIDRVQMDRLLKPRINRLSTYVNFLLFTYVLAQIAAVILLSLNIHGYQGNLTMQAVSGILILLCLLFLFAGRHLFTSFRKINKKNGDILGLLKNQIIFFRHKFESWNFIAAATLWILVFAFNAYVDNVDGTFRINKPFFFIAVSMAMMVFIYAVNKSAAFTIFKETQVCLSELENAWEGIEESMARIKKRQIILTTLSAIILTILFIIGLLVFLSGA